MNPALRPAPEPTREALIVALAQRDRELADERRRAAAMAEVLEAINSSSGDLAAVFDAIVEKAMRLCDAACGGLWAVDGEFVRPVNTRDLPEPYREFLSRGPVSLAQIFGRAARDRPFLHIEDLAATEAYSDRLPITVASVELGRVRTFLGVPLREGDRLVGIINLVRQEARPFSDEQIAIVRGFAVQAEIAMKNARLFSETRKALERQTATSAILRVISQSPTDARPVFESIVVTAARLLGCDLAFLLLCDGGGFSTIALASPEGLLQDTALGKSPIDANANFPSRAILAKEMLYLPDWSLVELPEHERKVHELFGVNSSLYLPLLHDAECIGLLTLVGKRSNIFGSGEIAQAESFRDQALIAIENARQFDEVQARTRELTESLEQQTAAGEILRVISSSPTDLQPVFDAIARSASELCEGSSSQVFLYRNGVIDIVAHDKTPNEALAGALSTFPAPPHPGTASGRAILRRAVVHIPDIAADPEYSASSIVKAGLRTILSVPMLRNGEPIGVINATRTYSRPYTDRQIELLKTFADQAVIAINNVGLFNETQEALKQQTATADVLKVISRSTFDLQTVLDTLVQSAATLCEAERACVFQRDGDLYRWVSNFGFSSELVEYAVAHPFAAGLGSTTSRVALEGRTIHNPDVLADPNYIASEYQRLGDYRTNLGVPLLREGAPIGVFVLARRNVRPFTQRQIELVQSFADQAVIAIENVRLFDEVQARTRDLSEALQLQTATSEVLKVISRSAFDLQAVFDTLIASAVELCGAFSGTICVRDGDVYRYRGIAGATDSAALAQYLAEHPATPGRGSMAGRALLSGKVEAISDRLEDAEFVVPMDAHGHAGRALLGVPLQGKDGIAGALVLTRIQPGHFTERQIEIVQTFADQAVIAIENVRLFDEVQARTRELAASLDDLRKAQDRLVQTEKLASLGQLTAGIAHEIKNPLNFVNNFSALSRELLDELRDALANASLKQSERGETDELIEMVASNLDKVVSHGKRADSIVKNMLLHSREGSGERTSVDVNSMVEEALSLAYHGARAEKPGFNVTIVKSLDPRAGDVDLHAQEMTRVLLNVISNGFYATAKRRQVETNQAYEPTIVASTRDLGHSVEIAIRDNGTGIPEEVRAKMFNPFFTTKPAGEGTGLGLSLSHDIVVKQHGGALEVATELGSFTEFTIRLPRAGDPGSKKEDRT